MVSAASLALKLSI